MRREAAELQGHLQDTNETLESERMRAVAVQLKLQQQEQGGIASCPLSGVAAQQHRKRFQLPDAIPPRGDTLGVGCSCNPVSLNLRLI